MFHITSSIGVVLFWEISLDQDNFCFFIYSGIFAFHCFLMFILLVLLNPVLVSWVYLPSPISFGLSFFLVGESVFLTVVTQVSLFPIQLFFLYSFLDSLFRCLVYYHFTPCEFFQPANISELSVESEWKQVFSGLQASLQYSGQFHQCCNLNRLNSYSDFQFFGDLPSMRTMIGITINSTVFLVLWQNPSICLSFHFLLCTICGLLKW